MFKKIITRIKAHLADPHHINRDWDEFKAMNQDRLRLEFERLLTYNSHDDKFRRLCQYIATHWVYDPRPDWETLKEEKKRNQPSPVILARIGDIVEEVQEWKQDDRIYLLEDLNDLLYK